MYSAALLVLGFSFIVCDEQVQFAAVLFRHGDRTPVASYPTDPWRNESLWPVRFGQLTNTGKRQHYNLGQWLRKRYSHLLSDQYDPQEIHIISTDVDRTLMSAQANLAGMFPPHDSSLWNPDLLWQPIPVHTVPEKKDEILAMKKPCPTYNKEHQQYIQSKKFQEALSKYQGLMDYLTAYTGRKIKDYEDILDIYSTLYIESLYNFTLPNWTRTVYPDKMREPAYYSFKIDTATPTLARLKVGPLIQDIFKKMSDSVNATRAGRKLKVAVYSAHDYTVACLLNALGMFDGIAPPYTAMVLMEALFDKNGDPLVRISYRNSTEVVEPRVLEIPYCGATCPLTRFNKLYHNLLTVNWEYECGAQFLQTHFFIMAFFLGLGIIVLVYTAHKVYFAIIAKKSRDQNDYARVVVVHTTMTEKPQTNAV